MQVFKKNHNLLKYKNFYKCLINKNTMKPNKDTRYASQGCCQVNEQIFITSYDTKYSVNKKENTKLNSRLDIIDNNTVKTLYFDNTSHVGGIAFIKEKNKIVVSGNNSINYYDLNYINNLNNFESLNEYKTYNLNKDIDNIEKASYITYFNSRLYIGEFSKQNKTNLVEYVLTKDETLSKINIYKVPYKKIQGLAIKEYKRKKYYFFSSSNGRNVNSKLIIATLSKKNKFKTQRIISLPCLLEQISFDKNGNLMIIFESDCNKYKYGLDRKKCSTTVINNICYLDTKKLLNLSKNNTK